MCRMFWIKYYADIWVYPLFAFMSWPAIGFFLVACWALLVLFYFVGQKITDTIWGTTGQCQIIHSTDCC